MNSEEELIDRELLPQVVYQNVLDGIISIREAFMALDTSLHSTNEVLKTSAKELGI